MGEYLSLTLHLRIGRIVLRLSRSLLLFFPQIISAVSVLQTDDTDLEAIGGNLERQ